MIERRSILDSLSKLQPYLFNALQATQTLPGKMKSGNLIKHPD